MTELILYTGPGNASERVLWALNYKGLAYKQADAGAAKAEGRYTEINPFGYVPTLIAEGHCLAESVVIAEYLEECCPEPPLLPGSALQRAQIREICEFVNSTIHPAQNRSIMNFLRPELSGQAMQDLRAQWLRKSLLTLQTRLCLRSAYAVGQEFSLADIFVAVIYKRALSQGVQPQELPQYAAYADKLFAEEKIRKSAPFAWPL